MYWATGVLGIAFMFAPFAFGYVNNTPAFWTSFLVGLATVGVSWMEGRQKDKKSWEYWTAGILGLTAIVAPFVLGFNTHAIAMGTSVVLGVLIALFAGSRLSIGQWGET